MQNIAPEIIKSRNAEHNSDSPSITFLWIKNKSKDPNPTFMLWSTLALALLIIAFAFINKGFFFKEMIAAGLILLMGGLLKWLDRSKQGIRTVYYQNNLN